MINLGIHRDRATLKVFAIVAIGPEVRLILKKYFIHTKVKFKAPPNMFKINANKFTENANNLIVNSSYHKFS
jgi:hypothetical protein